MTLSDCSQLAHVIVLWQIQNLCYCIIFALFYFVFEGNFQAQASKAYIRRVFGVRSLGGGGLYLEGLIFGVLQYVVF